MAKTRSVCRRSASCLVLLLLLGVCALSVMLSTELDQLLQHLKTSEDIEGLKRQKRQTVVSTQGQGGAVYIRWGRKTCPTTAEMVYSGAMAGGHYTHKGGAPEHLCLPEDPDFDQYNDAVKTQALIYGAEYELQGGLASNFPFSADNLDGSTHVHDQNIPCAVCRSQDKATALMIPGKNQCYSGWNMEYKGYLMGSAYTHANKNYACIDEDPEAVESGYSDQNGDILYMVETACGSLACPPYVNGRELTCVVCTK